MIMTQRLGFKGTHLSLGSMQGLYTSGGKEVGKGGEGWMTVAVPCLGLEHLFPFGRRWKDIQSE